MRRLNGGVLGIGGILVAHALLLGACGPADEVGRGRVADGTAPDEEFAAQEQCLAPVACPTNTEVCSGPAEAAPSCFVALDATTMRKEFAQTFKALHNGWPGRVRFVVKRLQDPPAGTHPQVVVNLLDLTPTSGVLVPSASGYTASAIATARVTLDNTTPVPTNAGPPAPLALNVDTPVELNLTAGAQMYSGRTYAIVFTIEQGGTVALGAACHADTVYADGTVLTRQMRRIGVLPTDFTSPAFTIDKRDLTFSITLDDGCYPTRTTSCGTGVCAASVVQCKNGVISLCEFHPPAGGAAGWTHTRVEWAEADYYGSLENISSRCNRIDDDCDGGIDNPSTAVCPKTAQVAATNCTATPACVVTQCNPDAYDINAVYTDGCECVDDTAAHGATATECKTATLAATVTTPGTSASFTGKVPTKTTADWLEFRFPDNYVGTTLDQTASPDGTTNYPKPSRQQAGVARIQFSSNPGSQFKFEVRSPSCPGGAFSPCSGLLTDFEFRDTCFATPADDNCTGRLNSWPSTVWVRVVRASGDPVTCADYSLLATRDCGDDTAPHGTTATECKTGTLVGTLTNPGDRISYTGTLPVKTTADWLEFKFPSNLTGTTKDQTNTYIDPGYPRPSAKQAGALRIQLTYNPGSKYQFEVRSPSCPGGTAAPCTGLLTDWQLADNCTASTTNNDCSTRSLAWPASVWVRVVRTGGEALDCSSYTVTATR